MGLAQTVFYICSGTIACQTYHTDRMYVTLRPDRICNLSLVCSKETQYGFGTVLDVKDSLLYLFFCKIIIDVFYTLNYYFPIQILSSLMVQNPGHSEHKLGGPTTGYNVQEFKVNHSWTSVCLKQVVSSLSVFQSTFFMFYFLPHSCCKPCLFHILVNVKVLNMNLISVMFSTLLFLKTYHTNKDKST